MRSHDIKIKQIQRSELYTLSKFVVDQNLSHYQGKLIPDNYEDLIKSVYQEEIVYFKDSQYFIATDRHGTWLGSIRLLRWNIKHTLPFENIFALSVLDFATKDNNAIWHIGRFAIKKGVCRIDLFKKLILYAITPICHTKNSLAFAECDVKLRNTLTRMGIISKPIADPIHYLGSETIPISLVQSSLIYFLESNESVEKIYPYHPAIYSQFSTQPS